MSTGTENESTSGASGNPSEEDVLLTFHYIKSNHFRVIHVDGMIGGISPAGDAIELALFSERVPIPLRTVQKINPDGTQQEVDWDGRDGITREVDVNAIMSIETAEMVATWLLKQVRLANELQEEEEQQ
jgi:YD repeat-containing protein